MKKFLYLILVFSFVGVSWGSDNSSRAHKDVIVEGTGLIVPILLAPYKDATITTTSPQ